jgi:hypothetical protein
MEELNVFAVFKKDGKMVGMTNAFGTMEELDAEIKETIKQLGPNGFDLIEKNNIVPCECGFGYEIELLQ